MFKEYGLIIINKRVSIQRTQMDSFYIALIKYYYQHYIISSKKKKKNWNEMAQNYYQSTSKKHHRGNMGTVAVPVARFIFLSFLFLFLFRFCWLCCFFFFLFSIRCDGPCFRFHWSVCLNGWTAVFEDLFGCAKTIRPVWVVHEIRICLCMRSRSRICDVVNVAKRRSGTGLTT